MIILGIDPGSTLIGYGVVEYKQNKFSSLGWGTIKNGGQDKLLAFKNTEQSIQELIKKFKPDRAGVEKLFFANNQKTVMAVSEMRGVILNTIGSSDVEVFEMTPLQVKQGVANYGQAAKSQMQKIVKMILGVKEDIRPDDAADALAIAIYAASM